MAPPSVSTICARRRSSSSASRSPPRLYGESCARHRISSTHERPIPAITCWSRSSACSGPRRVEQLAELGRLRPRLGAELRERLVELELGDGEQLHPGRLRASRTRAGAAHARSAARAAGARSCRGGRPACRRAAGARRTSGASAVRAPRCSRRSGACRAGARRGPARPTSAVSGGSKLRSALMPGARAYSIRSPRMAPSSRRAVISTSGSSGIARPS